MLKFFAKCPSRRDLERFLDSDFGFRREKKISAHVDNCEHCQALLDDLTTEHELPSFFAGAEVTRHGDRLLPSMIGLMRNETWLLSRDQTTPTPASPSPASPSQLARAAHWRRKAEREPQQMVGQYRLLEVVGQGGSGVVYRAFDTKLDRVVAVKMLRPNFCNQNGVLRMEREAKSIAAISHRNILSVIAFEKPDAESASPSPYLVTEYVDGQSLEMLIRESGAMDPTAAAKMVLGIAHGLAAAHRESIVHRDIKSSNVLLDGIGRPKLADFGLAIDESFSARITSQGVVAGTLAYMSPEQLNDPDKVDRRADIYGLGIVLYECLTGELPFRGVARATIERILHESPRDPMLLNASVHRDLNSICLKAISKSPARRYQTAEEFSDDLTRWLEGRATVARPVSYFEKARLWATKNRLAAALLLLSGLLTIAVFAGLLNSNRLKTQLLAEKTRQAKWLTLERDKLVSIVADVVHDINDHVEEHDWSTIDPDDLQQRALTISIDGLAEATRIAEASNLAGGKKVANTKELEAEFQLRLGVVSFRRGEIEKSIEAVDRTIKLSEELLSADRALGYQPEKRKRIENVLNRGETWRILARFDQGHAADSISLLDRKIEQFQSRTDFDQADLLWLGDLATVTIKVAQSVEDSLAETYYLASLELAESMYGIIDTNRFQAVHTDETFYAQFAADETTKVALSLLSNLKFRTNSPQVAQYDYRFRKHMFLIAPYTDSIEVLNSDPAETEEFDSDEDLDTYQYWEMTLKMVEQEDMSIARNLDALAVCKEMLASLRHQDGRDDLASELLQDAVDIRGEILDFEPANQRLFRQWINSRMIYLEMIKSDRRRLEKEIVDIEQDIEDWQAQHGDDAERSRVAIRWHKRVLFTFNQLRSATDS